MAQLWDRCVLWPFCDDEFCFILVVWERDVIDVCNLENSVAVGRGAGRAGGVFDAVDLLDALGEVVFGVVEHPGQSSCVLGQARHGFGKILNFLIIVHVEMTLGSVVPVGATVETPMTLAVVGASTTMVWRAGAVRWGRGGSTGWAITHKSIVAPKRGRAAGVAAWTPPSRKSSPPSARASWEVMPVSSFCFPSWLKEFLLLVQVGLDAQGALSGIGNAIKTSGIGNLESVVPEILVFAGDSGIVSDKIVNFGQNFSKVGVVVVSDQEFDHVPSFAGKSSQQIGCEKLLRKILSTGAQFRPDSFHFGGHFEEVVVEWSEWHVS
jgi:hypothetical protein